MRTARRRRGGRGRLPTVGSRVVCPVPDAPPPPHCALPVPPHVTPPCWHPTSRGPPPRCKPPTLLHRRPARLATLTSARCALPPPSSLRLSPMLRMPPSCAPPLYRRPRPLLHREVVYHHQLHRRPLCWPRLPRCRCHRTRRRPHRRRRLQAWRSPTPHHRPLLTTRRRRRRNSPRRVSQLVPVAPCVCAARAAAPRLPCRAKHRWRQPVGRLLHRQLVAQRGGMYTPSLRR